MTDIYVLLKLLPSVLFMDAQSMIFCIFGFYNDVN